MKKILLPAVLSALLVVPTLAAAEPVPARTFYFGGHAGQYFSDITDRYDYDQPADTTLPGVQIGYRISDRWSVQALWAKHDFNSEKIVTTATCAPPWPVHVFTSMAPMYSVSNPMRVWQSVSFR